MNAQMESDVGDGQTSNTPKDDEAVEDKISGSLNAGTRRSIEEWQRSSSAENVGGHLSAGSEGVSEAINGVSAPAPQSVALTSSASDDLWQEADYYNRKALERASIGEASNGATRDWTLVDVPPGTYSVSLNGIGGGSQVITWQLHNGARKSRFIARDQEFVASPNFKSEGTVQYSEPLRDSDLDADYRRSSLEMLLKSVGSRPDRHGGFGSSDVTETDVDLAASYPLPSSSPGPISRSQHGLRSTFSNRTDQLEVMDSSRDDEGQRKARAVAEAPQRGKAVTLNTPSGERSNGSVGQMPYMIRNTILSDESPPDTASDSSTSVTPSQDAEPDYGYVRFNREVRYGSGADYSSSSESEVLPEDSISRTMRPGSASSTRSRTQPVPRSRDRQIPHQSFNIRQHYRGLLYSLPKDLIFEDLDAATWVRVTKLRMPLQRPGIFYEAMQRAGTLTPLDQYLALPTDFLRHQVDEEIKDFSAEYNGGRSDLEWCLLGVYIEGNLLLLFLVGVAENHNYITSPADVQDSDSPLEAQVTGNTGNLQDPLRDGSRGRSPASPRARFSPVPAGPGASVDDLGSYGGAHSAVSAYRPSINIASRYPIAQRQRSRGRSPSAQRGRKGIEVLNGTRTPTANIDPLVMDSLPVSPTVPKAAKPPTKTVEQRRDKASDVHFEDAMGRKFAFPWHLARTYEGMKDLIETAFAKFDDWESRVSEGRFDLLGPSRQIILPKLWEDVVEPGWTITMQMWPIANTQAPAEFDPLLRTDQKSDTATFELPKSMQAPSGVPTPPRSQIGVDRVNSAGSKYVQDAFPSHSARPAALSTYIDSVETLRSHMPHLTNMLATDCRNPNAGKLYCWDLPIGTGPPSLLRESGPQGWHDGGNAIMAEILTAPTQDVKLRTIIVEDLSPALIESLGAALWLNPEFFEEHLAQSGYQGADCSGIPPKTWSTSATTKDYMSLKWHRPVQRTALKPHTPVERRALLDLNVGMLEWTASASMTTNCYESSQEETADHAVSVDSNIFRQCWPLVTDPESSHEVIEGHLAAVWEERATLYHMALGNCPLVVILLDPLPKVRHLIEERSTREPIILDDALYRQSYTRSSVGSTLSGSSVTSGENIASPNGALHHPVMTNSTAEDMLHWLAAASTLTPNNPDLSLVTALLWVIHRDTIGFMHLVSNTLEEIGLGSIDDYLMRTRLSHWRALISRFQVELPDLRTSLEAFAQLAQDINPVEPQHSIVSEFIPDTLLQIDILIEQNEKSYAALRADMGVLESRKAIAEAESVGKLTELAFIFIPLTFITGAFSVQIEELQTPAPLYAFIIAAVVAIILAYMMRLTMRSDSVAKWSLGHMRRVRKLAQLAPGSQVPARAMFAYALSFPVSTAVALARFAQQALQGLVLRETRDRADGISLEDMHVSGV